MHQAAHEAVQVLRRGRAVAAPGVHQPVLGQAGRRPARLAQALDVRQSLVGRDGVEVRSARPVRLAGETRQSGVHDVRARELAHLLVHRVPLLADHHREVRVRDLRGEVALHDRPAVVLLDVPDPLLALHHHVFREALLLEVPDGVVIRERDEVRHALLLAHVLLQVVHQARAVPFHLLVRGDGAERDLAHVLPPKRAVRDAADNLAVFHAQHGVVVRIEYQTHDVLLGHVRKLLAEDVLQRDEPDHVLLFAVVLDHLIHQLAVVLLLTKVYLARHVVPEILGLHPAQICQIRHRVHAVASLVARARAPGAIAAPRVFAGVVLAFHALRVGLALLALGGAVATEHRPEQIHRRVRRVSL
mmetsp:Transcript_7213/g.30726  ORF Transcript_7213/g.30726 Transcript_7213/m.30726 type:complete len:359 (+) Transcript_7213:370-1446(+)